MNMKSLTSEIGTLVKEVRQPTGMHSSECGLDDPSSLTEEQVKAIKRIPRLFLPYMTDLMLYRIYELKHLGHRDSFSVYSPVDKQIADIIPLLEKEIRTPTDEEIANCLKRVASVLQCNVPEEQGLLEYFKILSTYPLVLLEECTDYIIQTARYRKLPLPLDFIGHMEISRSVHTVWLDKLKQQYINYKE